jgi:hypothetical protein
LDATSLHKWAEHETTGLIAAGVNPLDAQRSIDWTLAHLPAGADPTTWIPTTLDLFGAIDKADLQDALAAWFLTAPTEYKRLLSAVVTNG